MNKGIRTLIRIQLFVVFLFIFFKAIRPTVIEEDTPALIKIFLYSFPNFAEAVAGSMMLCALVLIANQKVLKAGKRFRPGNIYILTIICAAVYVILQEFKIHNLGGANIYDPYDVIFSVLGLIMAYGILLWIKPEYQRTEA